MAQSQTDILQEFAPGETAVSAGSVGIASDDVYIFPASFAQQRLWFLDQLEPNSSTYNIFSALRLTGNLNVAALTKTLDQIVRRHEVLRTTFTTQDGQPVQVVSAPAPLPLRTIDISHLGVAERESEAQRIANEEASTPFNLSLGPLFRVTLLRLGEDEHALFLTMHHIISDAWSKAVLIREVTTLYEAFSAERESPLAELPIQYADYALWQRDFLQGEVLEQQLGYWKRQLSGAPELLELNTDFQRPAMRTNRGAAEAFTVSPVTSDKLKAISREAEVTLFMCILAAFQTLLYRYSGQQDICVGSPIANRSQSETEHLIGFFVNTLVLRAQLSPEQSFAELLASVRETCLSAYAHQDLPFEKLVDELQPKRNLSHTPLFQAMLVLQNAPQENLDLSGLRLGSTVSRENTTAKFDLALAITESAHDLSGLLSYSTDLFEASTIRRMVGHFQSLLEAVAADPRRRLSELPLLSEAEERQLLVGFNDTAREYPTGLCLHELFEQQAERTPDSVALIYEDEQLTYRELNGRANRLGHHLISLGVSPEDRVGVLMRRTPSLVVSLLAVLKAGAAYVPLDPSYPPQRLRFMMEDADTKVLVTDEGLRDLLPAPPHTRVVLVGGAGEQFADFSAANPRIGVTPGNLAYVIYTSGSTGKPKGVAIEHRSPCALMHWARETFDPSLLQGVLASTSVCFDLSVFEIFTPLSCGGRVILADDVLQLPHMSARAEVRLVNTVPSAMAELVRSGGVPDTVEAVNLAGEALKSSLVGEIYEGTKAAGVWNLYGPSEDTTYSTYCLVGRGAERVSIGRPVANTSAYILDGGMRPVPEGVSGELYLAGEGLARGYLHRAEQTAERFIPHPFGAEPGARLYRTGDVARYLPDGEIEYLGRADHQVKVRGFRIELGEIESALARHESIREAVVVAREDAGGHKRLVAYVVAEGGASGEGSAAGELRRYLKDGLPEYMVPSLFVMLDEMPLTPNGKVDRKALPAPELRPELGDRYVAQTTPVEEALADIWRKVLGLEQVGIHDNFFNLGGDSILSIQIVSRAAQAGLRLTPRQLFQHQTVAELAAVVTLAVARQEEAEDEGGDAPLTPIQEWFFERRLPEQHHWNQALLLEVHRPVDAALLLEAVAAVVTYHDVLRSRFISTAEGWRQVIDASSVSAAQGVLTVVDLSTVEGLRRSSLLEAAAEQAQAGLNLQAGPLLRLLLFRIGDGEPARLLVVIHHLVVDGVSWRVLLEDLQTAYRQLASGNGRVSLPAKTTSFRRWAQRLAEYADGEAVRGEIQYWLGVVNQQASKLPVDYPGGTNTEAEGDSVTLSLTAEETHALLHKVPAAYRTEINDALLTSLARALSRWCESRMVRVELEGHGREEIGGDVDVTGGAADVTRTLGWFTTLYPVLLEVGDEGELGEDLKRVKERLREVPQRGIGYGLLRYASRDRELREKLRAAGNAEVVFNYLGQLDGAVSGDSMWRAAAESAGAAHSPLSPRHHALSVTARVVGGRLHMSWGYSRGLHRRETVERVAGWQMDALRALISHCLDPQVGGYTPSDFPLARLNQQEVERLTTRRSRRIDDIYALTPMQQGMLFHHLLSSGVDIYFKQLSCLIEGELGAAALCRAWGSVARRHEALRTSFEWEGLGVPVAIVHREACVTIEEEDWGRVDEREQQERLESYLEQDRRRGFELKEAPLMRLRLVKLGERRHLLVWSHHHLLFDGWSLPLLFKEVFANYEAECEGSSVEAPRVRPYRDYIAWLQEQPREAAESYWRETLRGFTAPTSLGIEKAQAASDEAGELGEQRVSMSEEATAALQAFCRREQLTMSTLVQGAWALLLSRYGGQEDVVFGVTVSGRPAELSGVEEMVGLFINTLPMRVRVDEGQEVGEWLREVQGRSVEMRQYEATPLADIQRWGEVEGGRSLFDSLVVFENYPVEAGLAEQSEGSGSGLRVSKAGGYERTNYGLTLLAAAGRELRLLASYDEARVSGEGVARLLSHLRGLLEAVATNAAGPRRRLSELRMLGEAEEHRLLVGWNDTAREYPTDVCLQELFERQVERTPDAIALIFDEERLSYRELNEHANRLAHYLTALGVGPEAPVGICLERSVLMVVGLLGILKASGAYVPLNPDYPSERLAFMLEDSGVKVLLSEQSVAEKLPASLDVPVMFLDNAAERLAVYDDANPVCATLPDNLAYLIYTSGSTGRPKGAMNSHRAIVNRLLWMQDAFQLSHSDRVLQKTPFSFDVSVWEFFWPLITGASLVVARPHGHQDGAYLIRLILEQRITTLHFVPSMLQVFLEEQDAGRCAESLRRVVCSGEAMTLSLQERFFERLGGVELENLYGPTEAAVDVTHWHCLRGRELSSVPIGRPIANLEMYVLDGRLRPQPVGVKGELYIGGVGLGRGYINRAGQTAERFIPHPFSAKAGARLYRTGDLARYLHDGEIEYLGRADQQVKVRGFRIELGEIESALAQHERVREAAVVVREEAGGHKRLVAYVVAEAGSQEGPGVGELRRFVGERLPEYMVPSLFVTLDSLPLTPNGKVDRRALPKPDESRPDSAGEYVAPSTAVEQALADIWRQVLGLERVGIHDNFFDLGGHSLMAMQVVSRVRAELAVDLSLRDVFRAVTIAELARAVEESILAMSGSTDINEMLELLETMEDSEAQDILAVDEE